MKKLLGILKKAGIAIAALVGIILAVGVISLNYKSVLARHKVADVKNYAQAVDEIEIPENVKIVGLGEAAHGNVEFQELKLTVFKKLVEEYDFRAFALEANYSEVLAVNDYVQGGDGDIIQILETLSNPIYHTAQMAELADWMRDYNKNAADTDKVRFYGFDMQDQATGAQMLVDYCENEKIAGIESELALVKDLCDSAFVPEDEEKYVTALRKVQDVIEAQNEDIAYLCEVLSQYNEVYRDGENWYTYRDKCMEINVTNFAKLEAERGSGKIMIAGHDGHLQKGYAEVDAGDTEPAFGQMLSGEWKDAYFVIGTDFFTTTDNINTSSMMSAEYERKNHSFCSADVLAYQAKYMDGQMYYLDFSKVSEGKTYDLIHTEGSFGEIGEGYMFLWYLFADNTYRANHVAADTYDAMIYVYHADPIDPTDY